MSDEGTEVGALLFNALYLSLVCATGLAWGRHGCVRLAILSAGLTALCYVAVIMKYERAAVVFVVTSWAAGILAGLALLR
jgi:hypothetical protein